VAVQGAEDGQGVADRPEFPDDRNVRVEAARRLSRSRASVMEVSSFD
jgi:hypothetical protein